MWYAILLFFSVGNSCFAMDTADERRPLLRPDNPLLRPDNPLLRPDNPITVYPNKPLVTPGRTARTPEQLKAAALDFHAQREEVKGPLSKYAVYKEYLEKNDSVPMAETQDGQVLMHAYNNKLVMIPMDDELDLDYVQFVAEDEEPNLRFTACSVWLNPQFHFPLFSVCAVDTNGGAHNWWRFKKISGQYIEDYLKWNERIPGSITSIRQISDHAIALFYADKERVARVALAFAHTPCPYPKKKLVLSGVANVTHVSGEVRDGTMDRFTVGSESRWDRETYAAKHATLDKNEKIGERVYLPDCCAMQ